MSVSPGNRTRLFSPCGSRGDSGLITSLGIYLKGSLARGRRRTVDDEKTKAGKMSAGERRPVSPARAANWLRRGYPRNARCTVPSDVPVRVYMNCDEPGSDSTGYFRGWLGLVPRRPHPPSWVLRHGSDSSRKEFFSGSIHFVSFVGTGIVVSREGTTATTTTERVQSREQASDSYRRFQRQGRHAESAGQFRRQRYMRCGNTRTYAPT